MTQQAMFSESDGYERFMVAAGVRSGGMARLTPNPCDRTPGTTNHLTP
jgi:hypothetical protein